MRWEQAQEEYEARKALELENNLREYEAYQAKINRLLEKEARSKPSILSDETYATENVEEELGHLPGKLKADDTQQMMQTYGDESVLDEYGNEEIDMD